MKNIIIKASSLFLLLSTTLSGNANTLNAVSSSDVPTMPEIKCNEQIALNSNSWDIAQYLDEIISEGTEESACFYLEEDVNASGMYGMISNTGINVDLFIDGRGHTLQLHGVSQSKSPFMMTGADIHLKDLNIGFQGGDTRIQSLITMNASSGIESDGSPEVEITEPVTTNVMLENVVLDVFGWDDIDANPDFMMNYVGASSHLNGYEPQFDTAEYNLNYSYITEDFEAESLHTSNVFFKGYNNLSEASSAIWAGANNIIIEDDSTLEYERQDSMVTGNPEGGDYHFEDRARVFQGAFVKTDTEWMDYDYYHGDSFAKLGIDGGPMNIHVKENATLNLASEFTQHDEYAAILFAEDENGKGLNTNSNTFASRFLKSVDAGIIENFDTFNIYEGADVNLRQAKNKNGVLNTCNIMKYKKGNGKDLPLTSTINVMSGASLNVVNEDGPAINDCGKQEIDFINDAMSYNTYLQQSHHFNFVTTFPEEDQYFQFTYATAEYALGYEINAASDSSINVSGTENNVLENSNSLVTIDNPKEFRIENTSGLGYMNPKTRIAEENIVVANNETFELCKDLACTDSIVVPGVDAITVSGKLIDNEEAGTRGVIVNADVEENVLSEYRVLQLGILPRPEVTPITPEVDPLRPEVTPITPEVDPLRPEVTPITPEVDPVEVEPEVELEVTPEPEVEVTPEPEVEVVTPVEETPNTLPKTGNVNYAYALLTIIGLGVVARRRLF